MAIINIVGMGRGKELAPPDNCWGVNSLILERKVDVHFDMHNSPLMKPHQIERRKKIIKVANKYNIPVYSCHEVPNSTYRRYPIEDVLAMFPRPYFSNAICYMIALALIREYDEINLYGVNHAKMSAVSETYKFKDIVSSYDLDVMEKSAREYVESMWDVPQTKQSPTKKHYVANKPAVDYWVGVANGMGVVVNICNEESEICKTYSGRSYGYELTQVEMMRRYGPRNRVGNG